jgi:hypothetical protein
VHHRHVARDARENIYQEFRANQQDLARQLNALPAEEKHLDEILSVIDSVQHGRPHKPIGDFMWTGVLLRDSAWNAASSTGAIAYMDYGEVKQYSQLYAVQRILSSFTERNLQDRHEMNVFLMRLQTSGKLSDAEYENGKRIIWSEKLATREFREIDSMLQESYSRILPQGK